MISIKNNKWEMLNNFQFISNFNDFNDTKMVIPKKGKCTRLGKYMIFNKVRYIIKQIT